MRFSLDSTLLFLAFAHALVAPVSASAHNEPRRHVMGRASRGFRRSALHHSAGLARDLRVALRGLSTADTARHKSVLARSNLGKPYCVSNSGKSNSTANSDKHNPASSTSNPSASHPPTTSPTSSPGQSSFRLAQSYVSNDSIWSLVLYRPGWMERNLLMLTIWGFSSFRSLGILFSTAGISLAAATRQMGMSNSSISRPRCV